MPTAIRPPRHTPAAMKDPFGHTTAPADDRSPAGTPVHRYTLANAAGITARIIDYGATLTELHVPDRRGDTADIVLGFDDLRPYETVSPHMGSTTGRVVNRIAHGRFTLLGRTYQLAINKPPHHLHGGDHAIDKRVWQAAEATTPQGQAVRFEYFSPDGEEGFPGNVRFTVTYTLTHDNALRIDYHAVTDQPTPINLTNHSYFNLAGHDAGDVLGHVLELNAHHFTPTDATGIPTGQIVPVTNTPWDFIQPTAIGARIEQAGGYDVNYVINQDVITHDHGLERGAARVHESVTGRTMEVFTNEPGIQLYTANALDGTLHGKDNAIYHKYAALCLETQHYPDSVNQPHFPSIIVTPETPYTSTCIYRFDVE